ncbi:pyridoxamine 5'-phosphate oxidase [Bacterioplanoides sp.]|uniref:pyridoxamine 5'-phosphate oxidase n=1 Tax=Bacterioplanoides sp. TaxID=2066072 RepID=UPI003B5CF25B
MVDIADIRKEYTQGRLDEETCAPDPITQFHAWFEQYRETNPPEPTIMTMASCDENGQPWQRILLLKGYDEQGFVFFTNYESNKGQQLAENGKAALHFFWINMERQVQIQGEVEKISREDAERYFHSRPRESQLGAWASAQSRPLQNRQQLEDKFAAVSEQFEGQDVPLPGYWGGYRIKPQRMEFWQGGAHRLHDRVEYNADGNGGWQKQRLNP